MSAACQYNLALVGTAPFSARTSMAPVVAFNLVQTVSENAFYKDGEL